MHLVLLCVKWKWIAAFHLISTHTHTLLGTRETKTPDKQMKKKKNENFCCSIASHLVFFAVGCCCCCVKAKTIEHKTITRWISITESVGKKRRKQAIEMEMKSEEEKKMCIPTTDEHGSLCAYYRLHYGCGRVCARISSKYFPFNSIQFNFNWKHTRTLRNSSKQAPQPVRFVQYDTILLCTFPHLQLNDTVACIWWDIRQTRNSRILLSEIESKKCHFFANWVNQNDDYISISNMAQIGCAKTNAVTTISEESPFFSSNLGVLMALRKWVNKQFSQRMKKKHNCFCSI